MLFVPVECIALGYTLTGSNGCSAGQSQEFCPQNSSYYKCTGEIDAAAKCVAEGYTEVKINGFALCNVGQTASPCPYNNGENYKCTGEAIELPTDSCSSGFVLADIRRCADCAYGVLPNGLKSTFGAACYECGTKEECGCYDLNDGSGLSVECKCEVCNALVK